MLLAAGKRVGLALLEAGQTNLCKCRFNALPQFWIGNAKVLGTECHIVFDQARYDLIVGVLEDRACLRADSERILGIGGDEPINLHLAFIR